MLCIECTLYVHERSGYCRHCFQVARAFYISARTWWARTRLLEPPEDSSACPARTGAKMLSHILYCYFMGVLQPEEVAAWFLPKDRFSTVQKLVQNILHSAKKVNEEFLRPAERNASLQPDTHAHTHTPPSYHTHDTLILTPPPLNTYNMPLAYFHTPCSPLSFYSQSTFSSHPIPSPPVIHSPCRMIHDHFPPHDSLSLYPLNMIFNIQRRGPLNMFFNIQRRCTDENE